MGNLLSFSRKGVGINETGEFSVVPRVGMMDSEEFPMGMMGKDGNIYNRQRIPWA